MGTIIRNLLIIVAVTSTMTAPCRAEDWQYSAESMEETPSSDTGDFVIALHTAVCGFVLSGVGIVIAYYSYHEDSILQKYQTDGIPVEGDVLRYEPLRARHSLSSPCFSQEGKNELEYITVVYYKVWDEALEYTLSVQKRVRVLASDFMDVQGVHPSKVYVELMDTDFEEESFTYEGPKRLDLLLLSGYPRSALPRQLVQRACCWRQRVPSYCLVVLLLISAVACAMQSISSCNILPHASSGRVLGLIFLIGIVEWLAIYVFLGEPIHQSLRMDYLEGGNLAFIKSSDETLSTISSAQDSFL